MIKLIWRENRKSIPTLSYKIETVLLEVYQYTHLEINALTNQTYFKEQISKSCLSVHEYAHLHTDKHAASHQNGIFTHINMPFYTKKSASVLFAALPVMAFAS